MSIVSVNQAINFSLFLKKPLFNEFLKGAYLTPLAPLVRGEFHQQNNEHGQGENSNKLGKAKQDQYKPLFSKDLKKLALGFIFTGFYVKQYGMKGNPAILIYCPVPDKKTGEKISRALLQKQWIACANIIAGMDSLYRWEGKIAKSKEVLLICKTKQSFYKKISKEISNMHPYQTPAILSLKIEQAELPFLKWMDSALK